MILIYSPAGGYVLLKIHAFKNSNKAYTNKDIYLKDVILALS